MSEKFEGEKVPSWKILEDQKHNELQVAMAEEKRLTEEMHRILKNIPDRAEAEKVVLEKIAPLMDVAIKKTSEALNAWLDAANKK